MGKQLIEHFLILYEAPGLRSCVSIGSGMCLHFPSAIWSTHISLGGEGFILVISAHPVCVLHTSWWINWEGHFLSQDLWPRANPFLLVTDKEGGYYNLLQMTNVELPTGKSLQIFMMPQRGSLFLLFDGSFPRILFHLWWRFSPASRNV